MKVVSEISGKMEVKKVNNSLDIDFNSLDIDFNFWHRLFRSSCDGRTGQRKTIIGIHADCYLSGSI